MQLGRVWKRWMLREWLLRLLGLKRDSRALTGDAGRSVDFVEPEPSLLRLRAKLRSEFADSRRIRIAEQRRDLLLSFLSEMSPEELDRLAGGGSNVKPAVRHELGSDRRR